MRKRRLVMDFDIPNNNGYDMPEDTFFCFHFLAHRDILYTAKKNMKFGELTVELLNAPDELLLELTKQTVEFAAFCHNLAQKNDSVMGEFVDMITAIQETAIKLPPYCFTNIDLDKEKQLADRMKEPQFYGKLYDSTSKEYAIYDKYRQFYSTIGTSLLTFYSLVEEFSDNYLSKVERRNEDNFAAAWGAFNETSPIMAELAAEIPFFDLIKVSEIMDVKLGVSGMVEPDNANKLILVDTLEFVSAHSAIYYDLFKGIQYSRAPFRCQNCEHFFLSVNSYKVLYCNNKAPDQSNRTCRQVGAKNKLKEKAENNPIEQTYMRARKKYYQMYFRTYISDDDYNRILRYLQTMRDKAICGKTDESGKLITFMTLEELFERKRLFADLEIGGNKWTKTN